MMRLALVLLLLLAPLTAAAQDEVVTAPASLLLFGAFTYGGVWQGVDMIEELEVLLGRQLDIIHWYMNWETDWDPALLASVADSRRTAMISWQPHRQPVEGIAAGHYDAYIRSWAEGVRDYGRLVYLRPFPEMNGDWTSWNGNPGVFIQAWRHIWQIFADAGASNVRWVWSPNVTDSPRTEENRLEHYFPGAGYVDVLALDGFNWGTTRPDIGWRSAEEVFRSGYDRLEPLARRPIWFAEIGTTDEGGSKARWVYDLLTNSHDWFPRLTAIVWFDENKEADWRVASSRESLQAFRLLP